MIPIPIIRIIWYGAIIYFLATFGLGILVIGAILAVASWLLVLLMKASGLYDQNNPSFYWNPLHLLRLLRRL